MERTAAALRRAAPWIASLAAHALLLLLAPLSADLGLARAPVVERRVVLQLDDDRYRPPEPAVPSAPTIAASDLPLPTRLPLPVAAAPSAVPLVDATGPRSPVVAAIAPTAREVLDALPPVSAAATAAARVDAAAAEPTMRMEWSGRARTLTREVKPPFPRILSTTGQEAEVVARITVSPLGAVIDVEITRGSGYTEIDAAVESALRQCLYSRIEGKQNQIGTVYYRFPLERRD